MAHCWLWASFFATQVTSACCKLDLTFTQAMLQWTSSLLGLFINKLKSQELLTHSHCAGLRHAAPCCALLKSSHRRLYCLHWATPDAPYTTSLLHHHSSSMQGRSCWPNTLKCWRQCLASKKASNSQSGHQSTAYCMSANKTSMASQQGVIDSHWLAYREFMLARHREVAEKLLCFKGKQERTDCPLLKRFLLSFLCFTESKKRLRRGAVTSFLLALQHSQTAAHHEPSQC